jgi:hypothetical protein
MAAVQGAGAALDFRVGEEQSPVIIKQEWEITLAAPPEVVWDKVIQHADSWWCHSYKPGSTILIEAWPGGRFWERFADGVNGSLFGTIVYIEPPKVLKVVGQFALPGVANSAGVWRLEAVDGGTLFKASGEIFGLLDSVTLKDRKSGSIALVEAMRAWVEQGVNCVRE